MKLRQVAMAALNGVGLKQLGEWHESRPAAYHARRRLAPEEERLIGPAIDIRNTAEARNRINALLLSFGRGRVPPVLIEVAREEVGEFT